MNTQTHMHQALFIVAVVGFTASIGVWLYSHATSDRQQSEYVRSATKDLSVDSTQDTQPLIQPPLATTTTIETVGRDIQATIPIDLSVLDDLQQELDTFSDTGSDPAPY